MTDALDRIRTFAMDARLGSARIHVIDADTGTTLIDRAATRGGETASVMKVITAAVALDALGADARIPTRVVRGDAPGVVVLVGGGDMTLSRVPAGGATFYPDPARIDELAAATREALGDEPVTRVVLDDSLFAGGEWHDRDWVEEDRDPGGYMPRISALSVDADRDDPSVDDSVRSADPTGRAGAAFVAALGGEPELVRGTAPADAEQLAVVWSPPIVTLVREMLISSDNALAEALARLAAHASGESADFAGLARALRAALARFGVPVEGVELVDGSGLSGRIRVPAVTITDLLRRARLREGTLGLLDDLLNRSGPDGTMSAARFVGDNTVVGDAVRAKSGFIDSVHSLAGVVRTFGGRELVFAVFAMGTMMAFDAPARAAVDDFVTQLHLSGDALEAPLLLPE